jgi:hypothetical protein
MVVIAITLTVIATAGSLLIVSFVFRTSQHLGTNETCSEDSHGTKIHLFGDFATLVAEMSDLRRENALKGCSTYPYGAYDMSAQTSFAFALLWATDFRWILIVRTRRNLLSQRIWLCLLSHVQWLLSRKAAKAGLLSLNGLAWLILIWSLLCVSLEKSCDKANNPKISDI